MRIHIAAPASWSPILEKAVADASPRQRQWVGAIMRCMHDRHIGITPSLALGFLKMLGMENSRFSREATFSRIGNLPRPWNLVAERLRERLGPDGGKDARRRSKQSGIWLGASPFYAVSKIAAPLVGRACQEVGSCYLFGEQETTSSQLFELDYKQYDEAVTETVARLSTAAAKYARVKTARAKTASPGGSGGSDGMMSELFWSDRALCAAGLSRDALNGRWNSSIPATDPVLISLVLRQELGGAEKAPERTRKHTSPAHGSGEAAGERPKQGGVEGIRLSAREDDFGDMLHSEYINPDLIRIDRMINTGILVRHRPPPATPRRDLLAAAIFPPASYSLQGSSVRVAKAAWFDSAARLSVNLEAAKLRKSDFLCIEGDAFGGMKSCFSSLEQMPEISGELLGGNNAAYRCKFLTALDWAPRFFDFNARCLPEFELPKKKDECNGAAHASKNWMRKALLFGLRKNGAQNHNQRGQRFAEDSPLSALQDYGAVHITAFLPLGFQEEATALAREVNSALCLSPDRGQKLTVVWLPPSPLDPRGWSATERDKPPWRVFAPPGNSPKGENDAAELPLRLAALCTVLADGFQKTLEEGIFGG